MSLAGVTVSATIAGHDRIDFDKKPIRRTLVKEGAAVRKIARRLIARRAISGPGEMPGRRSGVLMRAVKVKVGSGGFWVKVAPTKTSEMKDFYPAYLYYGTSTGLAARDNYMAYALNERRPAAQSAIMGALKTSLIAR